MNILCPHCERLSELTGFRMEGTDLIVRCDRCEAETRVVARGDSGLGVLEPSRVISLVRGVPGVGTEGDPFSVPAGFCPKCIATRREETFACAHCGLVYSNFQPSEVALSARLRKAFSELWTQGYGEDLRHDAVIGVALQTGELARLGRLYRIQLARHPQDCAAQRGRDEVLRFSMEQVDWVKTDTLAASQRLKRGVAVAVILVSLVLSWLLLRRVMPG